MRLLALLTFLCLALFPVTAFAAAPYLLLDWGTLDLLGRQARRLAHHARSLVLQLRVRDDPVRCRLCRPTRRGCAATRSRYR